MIDSVKAINPKSDVWKVAQSSSLGEFVTFYFDFLPNDWFKKAHKEATIECMTLGKPSLNTLNRYNYSLRHFVQFLNENNIYLQTYEHLLHEHIEMFIFYLQKKLSNSAANVCVSALKWIIYHGQSFKYDGFPTKEIFSGEEYATLKVDDVLKTKVIPDFVFNKINDAINTEPESIFKCIIEIGIDTGVRISEALDLTTCQISEAPNGTPILHVINNKNGTERFIPVSKRVKKAVQMLEKLSEKGRKQTGLDSITLYLKNKRINGSYQKCYAKSTQFDFRKRLSNFVSRNRIEDKQGSLYPLTYHSFRHTLGTHMLNNGMDFFEVQDYLGHESLHSTAHYAKILNPTIIQESKKLGFVGVIVEEISQRMLGLEANVESEAIKLAALPDGSCKKPINNEGKVCRKFNMCLLCPKFITTPEHLPIHRKHLERLILDKEQYMADEYIGTVEHLTTIENSLADLIERLESMSNGR